MSHAIQGRAGLTAQMPLEYALRLGEIADSRGISLYGLTLRALLLPDARLFRDETY